MKKYIKEIIYSPEEIGIKLIYKDFSVEDAQNINVNNPQSRQNIIDAKCRGANGTGEYNKESFSEFLEFEYQKMVVGILNETQFIHYDNNVHKHRNKALTDELRIRERHQYC